MGCASGPVQMAQATHAICGHNRRFSNGPDPGRSANESVYVFVPSIHLRAYLYLELLIPTLVPPLDSNALPHSLYQEQLEAAAAPQQNCDRNEGCRRPGADILGLAITVPSWPAAGGSPVPEPATIDGNVARSRNRPLRYSRARKRGPNSGCSCPFKKGYLSGSGPDRASWQAEKIGRTRKIGAALGRWMIWLHPVSGRQGTWRVKMVAVTSVSTLLICPWRVPCLGA